MTSLKSSNLEPENCPKCGEPLQWRQAHPYPVKLQLTFGASFAAFLLFFKQTTPMVRNIWTIVQAILGILLIRARKRSHQETLRCIRCTSDLR